MKTSTLAAKIKFFRKEKGVSQFDLETLINASPGSISKIEAGKTEPTKETLFKIAKVLRLNKFEIDYLIGVTANPATKAEIDEVVGEYKEYFSKKGVFAYILDERNRLIYSSQDFQKLLGFSKEDSEKLNGMMLTEIMLFPELGINKLIRTDDYEGLLRHNFSRFYYENHFMRGDKYYERALRAINSDPIAKRIWDNLGKTPAKSINIFDSREVKFKVYGMNVKMVYSSEMIYSNSRFVMVEYTPTNPVMKLLSKIS